MSRQHGSGGGGARGAGGGAGGGGDNNNNNNIAVPSPPDFTGSQREDLQRLWNVQIQEVSDVHPTSESKAKPSMDDGLTMKMMSRLYAFFGAIANCYDNHHEQQQQQQQPGSVNDNSSLVKPLHQSCLNSYFRIFFTMNHNNNGNGANNNRNNNLIVRLRGGRRVFTIDYGEFMNELNRFEFGGEPPPEFVKKHSFGAYLYHFPLQALPAINVTLAFTVLSIWQSQNQNTDHDNNPFSPTLLRLNRFLDSCHLTVRFIHVMPQLPMADIKTGLVRKFISIKGHVVKARPKRLRVATADFSCQRCASIITHSFDQGRFSVPSKCSNTSQKCKGRNFTLIRPTARYIDTQELRLQEAQEESTVHAGRTPRQLEVELSHDLMDACRPGDIVLLACWVDAINSAIAAGRAGKRAQETSTYKLFLQAHSITTLSESYSNTSGNNNQRQQREKNDGSQYTQQQLQNITQLCHADHRCLSLVERRAFPFDLLVRSLCPSIIGHHAVKAGILLCLLGGTPPDSQQSDRGNTIRSNSHILIVGDPGMGKSQMLNAATQLAARSVYVGGNTSSTTGLTVTLTKEEGGETGIEAGALVLADQGVACIDELDKCKHLDGLLEAMEQQQVSIAKAGVVASLPARCSVIAAANPKHGSYNMSKTVAENLNMARPILSRFDLVFILRDRADKDQDRLVSSNIMNLYRKPGGGGTSGADVSAAIHFANEFLQAGRNNNNNNNNNNDINGSSQQSKADDPLDSRVPLEQRLAWVSSFNEPLPAELVRDYIAYAREFCTPKLTQDAAIILKDYYMDLRYPNDGRRRQDTVPITTRQLEALIRLSQARAKACLRPYVLKEDALDVVELLRYSVEQVHTDEYGIIDRARGGAAGQSNRKRRKAFTDELYRLVGVGADCTMEDLRRVADRVECPLNDFQTMIEDMRTNGTLMKKPDGTYHVLS